MDGREEPSSPGKDKERDREYGTENATSSTDDLSEAEPGTVLYICKMPRVTGVKVEHGLQACASGKGLFKSTSIRVVVGKKRVKAETTRREKKKDPCSRLPGSER